MSKPQVDKTILTDVSWWHWTLTIPLLATHLLGYDGTIVAAMALCAAAGAYFFWQLRKLRPYPVKVRIGYFALLVIGCLPWMSWIHWVQLVGTTAMVVAGYCPLIRMLSLLPLNRTEPLSLSLLWRAFVTEPCRGGIVSWSNKSHQQAGFSCALPQPSAPLSCTLPNQTPSQKERSYAQAN